MDLYQKHANGRFNLNVMETDSHARLLHRFNQSSKLAVILIERDKKQYIMISNKKISFSDIFFFF